MLGSTAFNILFHKTFDVFCKTAVIFLNNAGSLKI